MIKQAHLFVQGDVIGVGFRAWVKIQSKFHHVSGWVANVYDKPEVFGLSGGVEIVLQGSPEDVMSMINTVRLGSPISRVDDVETIFEDVKDVFDSFEIRKSRSFSRY